MIDVLYRDLRFGLRRLLKDPLFTLAAVVPIALGVGVNTAMFTVGDALLRKPLAIHDIERLAAVVQTPPDDKGGASSLTPADYLDVARQDRSFEAIAAYRYESRILNRAEAPLSLVTAAVSPGFFDLFGVPPQFGRTLGRSGDQNGDCVLVSHGLWHDRLGAAPVIGHAIELDSHSYTVIGVMPKSFNFPVGAELWFPLAFDAKAAHDRTSHETQVIAKLRPRLALASAKAELEAIARRLAVESPQTNQGWGLRALPLSQLITGRTTDQYVFFLLGGVLFVLLIACSNVANLLLARGTMRQAEMAIQEALGASRTRMISQVLTESTMIALIGAALSLPLAWCALRLIVDNMPAQTVKFVPGFESIEMDHTVLLLTLAMALLSGAFAGITPAVRLTQCNVSEVLKAGGRSGTASRTSTRLRSVLLTGEIALAMTLLVGTGWIVQSVHALGNVNPGSAPATVLTMGVRLPLARYPTALACEQFHTRLLDSLQSLPGLQAAAIASEIPYAGGGTFASLTVEGASPVRASDVPQVRTVSISNTYFESLHIHLRSGRNFTSNERADSPLVGIVSQGLARRFWPGQAPLGKRVQLDSGPAGRWLTIVGVASEISFNWLDEPSAPVLYLPLPQSPSRAEFVILRAARPLQVIAPVRQRIRAIDATLPALAARTWDTVIADSMIGLSYVAVIMTVLGVIALVLASFGLFGLMSYNLRLRSKELAIRAALGATGPVILRMVLGQALLLSGCGVSIGIAAASLIGRLTSHLLYGVNSLDASAYVLPGAALLLASLAAAYFPARRAARACLT